MSLDARQKTINLLTMCLKAGRTVKGFDSVCDGVSMGKVMCVLTAADASPKTVKEINFICGKHNVKVIGTDITKQEFAAYVGKNTAVVGICDKGFADGFAKICNS